MKRIWRKWNSCRPCMRGRAILGAIFQLVGSALLSFGLMYGLQGAAARADAASVFAAGPCPDCPAEASLESVRVQAREGSTLVAVGGTLPPAPAGLPADVRLEANDVELVLRPGADGFRVVTATKGGVPLALEAIAAGITEGHLVLDIRSDVLRAPVSFAVGLWKDGAYRGRIPERGRLEWSGAGAPRAPAASVAATPASSPAGLDVTALAGSCTAWTGQVVPAFAEPASASSGTDPDPRSSLPTRSISVTFKGTVPAASRPPFAVAAVIARAGQGIGGGPRAIDRIGSLQLWAYWDGAVMHKAIRTWNGSAWEARVDAAAETLTVALRTGSLALYWDGLRSGDRYGAVVAGGGGCRAVGGDGEAQPVQIIP